MFYTMSIGSDESNMCASEWLLIEQHISVPTVHTILEFYKYGTDTKLSKMYKKHFSA